jgi:hypothetical protein
VPSQPVPARSRSVLAKMTTPPIRPWRTAGGLKTALYIATEVLR